MNKLRKVLISVLSVMLLVCMGLFAAACDDGEETPSAEKVYYTVTVAEYDATQGSVTLSPAAENGKYEENTSVTVSVTPNTDYGVDSVKANGSALTANGEGKYVFTVKGDTTVSVTFKAQGEVPPADEKVSVTVTCGSEGSYTLDPAPVDGKIKKGESVTLTVTPNANYEVESVKVNGSEVTANSEGKYVFTVKGDTTVEITFKAQGQVPPADETVNVTVTCGSEGSYTLDPAPVDGKVAKGASVTLTVTPDDGYAIYDVTVNGRPAAKGEGAGVYTFTADGDTAVVIKFKEDTSSLPEAGVEFGLTWQGTWKSQDDTVTIKIGTKTMTFNDTPVTGVTSGADTSGQSYAFTTGGKSYQLEVANEAFSASSLLVLVSGATRTYVAHSFAPEIDQKYQGHWYATNSDIEMDITASEVTYNNTKATFVVDGGYVESYGSGSFDGEESQGTPVNANIYFALVGDNLYTLIWSDPYVSVGDTLFSKSQSSFVVPDVDWIGTWVSVSEGKDITIDVIRAAAGDKVTFNGDDINVDITGAFSYNGQDYDFTAKNNYMILHENTMDPDMGVITGYQVIVLVKSGVEELFIEEDDLVGTEWEAAGVKLTVSVEGKVTINEQEGKVIYKLAHDNGVGKFSYSVVAGTTVYDIYHDTEEILFLENMGAQEGEHGRMTLSRGKIDPQFVGTWNKSSMETDSSQIVIDKDKDKCTFNGVSINLLRSSDVLNGYVFTVTDDEGDSKTYTIELLEDFEAYLLHVSYVENNVTESAYYLKETTIPPVRIDDELVGHWTTTMGDDPIDIYETSIVYGRFQAAVFENRTDIDSNKISYFVYANGDLYFLIYTKTTKQIEFRNHGSSDAGVIYDTKQEHDMSVKLPDKFKGRWSDGNGNEIYVDSEGNLFYNGVRGILEATTSEDVFNVSVSGNSWTVQYKTDNDTLYWHYMQNIEQYFTKLVDVHEQIFQWGVQTATPTHKETVTNGNTLVVKGLFSGVVNGYGGFLADIYVNGAWYRLRMDAYSFGLNGSTDTNSLAQPLDPMYEHLQITGTEWNEANYLALFKDGGKAWVVVEATLLDNKLTYVVKTYASTDTTLQTAVTTTTYILTSTSDISSLEINYYSDKGDAEANVLEEAYVETVVRHSVTVTCEGGSYTLSPDAWNEKYFEEGTEVTLTVTAPQGKVVDTVTVNGSPVEANGGVYKFTVNSDTTVAVTFKEAEAGGDAIFDQTLQGKYTNEYTNDVVTVTANGVEMSGEMIGGSYTFTADQITDTSTGDGTHIFTVVSGEVNLQLTFNADGTLTVYDPVTYMDLVVLTKNA